MSWHNAGNWEGLGADHGAYILRDLFRAYNERKAAVGEAGITWLGIGTPTAEQIAGYGLRAPEIRSAVNQLIGEVYDWLDENNWYKTPADGSATWTPAEIEAAAGFPFSIQASPLNLGQYEVLRESFDRMIYRQGGYANSGTFPLNDRYRRTGSDAVWANVVSALASETSSPAAGLTVSWEASTAYFARQYRAQTTDTAEVDGDCVVFYWDIEVLSGGLVAGRNPVLTYGAQTQAISNGFQSFRWTFAGFPANDSLYLAMDYAPAPTVFETIGPINLNAYGYFDLSSVLADQT